MARTHNLGFPRIGAHRELKFALEAYWRDETSRAVLESVGAALRKHHWQLQAALDFVPVGDFSFYDHVLDMSFMLGNLPERMQRLPGDRLDHYFAVARGHSCAPGARTECAMSIAAAEMTKWFDTNYHYLVPEFTAHSEFALDASRLLGELQEAQQQGIRAKPIIIGPITYLWLGKARDRSDILALLPRLLPVYSELLAKLAEQGVDWVQLDEPALVTDLDAHWQTAFRTAYRALNAQGVKLMLATYFGRLLDNLTLACELPVHGIHLDAINARAEIATVLAALPTDRVLSIGIVNGRNVWKTDLHAALDFLEPIHQRLGERLWIAPSCSLLHVPVDVRSERALDPELGTWLAFAVQKLDEIKLLARALNSGRQSVAAQLADHQASIEARRASPRVHTAHVQTQLAAIGPHMGQRRSSYAQRKLKQAAHLDLPLYPTTTIGSFPQTADIRRARAAFKRGELGTADYHTFLRAEIERCVREQEALGLDVLVHGEAERNDMVEYFAEQLAGFAITDHGWVQSYGSRCVKPPILFGDVSRPKAMTVEWIKYAQSLTDKPMKGMLTGPVTMLNWSFVRDDQPRSQSCYQLALAIRAEVLDLEQAGIRIIQIDEAALREGLPLRRSQWADYLHWAIDAFRIAANGVRDETQIHTHMCYSEFNDILAAIAAMDADVITIETSRSDMELLKALEQFDYPNDIGPGVYDIHSPNIPSVEHIVRLIDNAARRIPAERLWINPDCGLKTRAWPEVLPALANMVAAAQTLRRSRTASQTAMTDHDTDRAQPPSAE